MTFLWVFLGLLGALGVAGGVSRWWSNRAARRGRLAAGSEFRGSEFRRAGDEPSTGQSGAVRRALGQEGWQAPGDGPSL